MPEWLLILDEKPNWQRAEAVMEQNSYLDRMPRRAIGTISWV
jgi:hypothetical protein